MKIGKVVGRLTYTALFGAAVIAAILAACSNKTGTDSNTSTGDEAPTSQTSASVDEYFATSGPLAEPATQAAARWSELAGSFGEADLAAMGSDELSTALEALLDAANTAYVAYRDAHESFLTIAPPDQCDEVHAATTDALSLASRGYLELKGYIDSIQVGQPNETLRDRGNELLAEADTRKQEARLLMDDSGCQ